jgi:hypothetical protein
MGVLCARVAERATIALLRFGSPRASGARSGRTPTVPAIANPIAWIHVFSFKTHMARGGWQSRSIRAARIALAGMSIPLRRRARIGMTSAASGWWTR